MLTTLREQRGSGQLTRVRSVLRSEPYSRRALVLLCAYPIRELRTFGSTRYYWAGSRARRFGGSSGAKSLRRRAETESASDSEAATSDDIDTAWSPDCWHPKSSVDESLPQCNCFGPMNNGARPRPYILQRSLPIHHDCIADTKYLFEHRGGATIKIFVGDWLGAGTPLEFH